MIADLTLLR